MASFYFPRKLKPNCTPYGGEWKKMCVAKKNNGEKVTTTSRDRRKIKFFVTVRYSCVRFCYESITVTQCKPNLPGNIHFL